MAETKKPLALIVGGTSGLGYEMAQCLQSSHTVQVTGRNEIEDFPFHYFNMSTKLLSKSVRHLVGRLGVIDTLIIAAGYLQKGKIDELPPDEILAMVQTNIIGPALVVREVLLAQKALPRLMVVTSTSEWVPRLNEPIYAATKRGMAGLAESLAEDDRIGKTLVVAPSKMATKFWQRQEAQVSEGLDPRWVADQALSQFNDTFVYRHVKILRDPERIEVSKNKETR